MIIRHDTRRRIGAYLDLLREMAGTEFRLRDQGTFLGFLWTLLYPALMFAVLYVVFVKWMGHLVENYGAYLLIGLLFWNFFQKSTSSALTSLARRYSILRNFRFPREIVVFSTVAAVLYSFLLETAVLLVFLPFIGVLPKPAWLLLPFIVATLLLLAAGVSLLLPILAAEYRDMERIWEVLMMTMFYVTPVFYPLSVIGEHLRPMLYLNPVTHIIIAARGCLIDGALPNPGALAGVALFSALLFGAGMLALRKFEYRIMDKLME
ncbi:MAG: ABC transporter permease [Elusimicrobiales bacterium]|nr:ABC transporter permease [Elusimicrobiales bacterium]